VLQVFVSLQTSASFYNVSLHVLYGFDPADKFVSHMQMAGISDACYEDRLAIISLACCSSTHMHTQT